MRLYVANQESMTEHARKSAAIHGAPGKKHAVKLEEGLNEGDKYDQKLSAIAEEVLGKAIGYFTGLLEDPNIWTSDMMGFGGEVEEGLPDLENHLNAEIFTAARISQLLQSVAQKFLILTPDEIQKWQDDSLEFFINQKEQANDIRGNFLRDKSNDLIAALGLRYGSIFEEFCTKIVGEL